MKKLLVAQRVPRVGHVVCYTLTADDAAQINRRRTTSREIGFLLNRSDWPKGAQAHIGSHASAGETVPLIVTGSACEESKGWLVNGQAMLDGTDTLWVQNVPQHTANLDVSGTPGAWSWPVLEP